MNNSLRLAGWAGVIGIAVTTLGSGLDQIWRFPSSTATPQAIAGFVGRNHALLEAGQLLNTLGLALWLVAGAGVWASLRRDSANSPVLLCCLALGFAGFIVMLWVGFTAFWVVLYRGQTDLADARLLYDLAFATIAMSGIPTALAAGAFAALAARGRAFPPASVVLAGACAISHVLLLATFLVPAGFFSLQGQVITAVPATLFAWILASSLGLLRGGARPSTVA